MNKCVYQVLTILFTLCFIFLSGCTAVNSDNPTSESVLTDIVTEAETSPLDLLPKTDLDGWEMKILCATNKRNQYCADEIVGETLNDAVYTTYAWVKEKYNVKITVDDLSDGDGTYQTLVSKAGDSGDDVYNIYAMFLASAAGTYAVKGYFSDWNNIPYVSDHFNNDWWSDDILKSLQFKGRNFFLNGSLGYATIGSTHAMMFNKDLFDNYSLTYPYQSVFDGKWTLETFSSLITDKNADVNGDGNMKQDDDFYGFMSGEWRAPVSMSISCDLESLVYNEDGYPVLNFYTEKTVDVYNKVFSILNQSPLCPYADDALSQKHFKAFTEGRALMISDVISTINSLRNMEYNFGIIPYPKYDEKQDNYISLVDAGVDTLIVPVTNNNLDNTGLITEALCEKAFETITPAYYEITLQRKSSRDAESEEMLDIIRDSAAFDALYIYNFGGLGFAFKTWIQSGVTDISSKYTSLEKSAFSAIDKMWSVLE